MRNNLSLVVAGMLMLTGCNLSNNEKVTDITLNAKSATLVESNNSFGYTFFQKVVATESADKNLMVSPLSVSQALSMAVNGAGGNTFSQMEQVLGFGDYTLEDLNQCNQTITSALVNHDSKVTMKIANSVWYRDNFVVKDAFINNNKQYYSAEVSSFDPSQPDKAKDKMNKWVDDKTNGKIDKIIKEVNADDAMFLINAIYFNAKWKTEFKKSATTKASFTLDNGTEKQVNTMVGEDIELSYTNEENYSVIKLPYGGGKFDMVIYLPEEGTTTTDISGAIENTDLDKLFALPLSKKEIWLPSFEFSYSNKLNDELEGLGMTDAFDPITADFSGISDNPVVISEVMHKTYIKTNEEGTEAAAATSVTFTDMAIGPNEIIKVDRSFLFAIVEEDTHSILFMGRVYDPSVQE